MSLADFLQYTTWAFFLIIFVATARRAARHPLRTNLDVALFFGALAAAVLVSAVRLPDSRIVTAGTPEDLILGALAGALILALPYLMVRLLGDFAPSPRWLPPVALLLWLGTTLPLFVIPEIGLVPPWPLPAWLQRPAITVAQIVYLVGFLLYTAAMFVRQGRRSLGLTRRRLSAVGAGYAFLGLLFVVALRQTINIAAVAPALDAGLVVLSQFLGLASGISFYLGFAPPAILRRAWQEPEVRAFLSKAARLPRLPDTHAVVAELEESSARSLGVPAAAIGLWDETREVLRFHLGGAEVQWIPQDAAPTGEALLHQRVAFRPDVRKLDGSYSPPARHYRARAVLAAPITAGPKRLGVLSVFAPHAPIFAEDDLELIQLLADQAAVILESRALIDEAARVRAREEATRLRDDFLSSAAHDLKTPLTTLVAQAQHLQRQIQRRPDAPANAHSVARIAREAERLRSLVLDLLDASRAEQGRLVAEREPVDLVELARATAERLASTRHPVIVQAAEPVVGEYDGMRIVQLLENLIENAMKYSPEGGEVVVRIWADGPRARLAVADRGIGIPPEDLPHIFDRFYRAQNVDDRRFAGLGLGLYICRAIAEQHGGRIWAASQPGRGTTFEIALPKEEDPNGDNGAGDRDGPASPAAAGDAASGATGVAASPASPASPTAG